MGQIKRELHKRELESVENTSFLLQAQAEERCSFKIWLLYITEHWIGSWAGFYLLEICFEMRMYRKIFL